MRMKKLCVLTTNQGDYSSPHLTVETFFVEKGFVSSFESSPPGYNPENIEDDTDDWS